MTLKEYIKGLNDFAKQNPEALERLCVTSKDDEGNGFNSLYYSPSKGIFEDGEFIYHEELEEYDRSEYEVNAVCVN